MYITKSTKTIPILMCFHSFTPTQ